MKKREREREVRERERERESTSVPSLRAHRFALQLTLKVKSVIRKFFHHQIILKSLKLSFVKWKEEKGIKIWERSWIER